MIPQPLSSRALSSHLSRAPILQKQARVSCLRSLPVTPFRRSIANVPTSPAGSRSPPGSKRGMSTMSTVALFILLPTSFYVLGSLFPPSTLQIMFPRTAPPPAHRESPEGKEYTEALEQELQGLDVVKQLREQVEASDGEWYEHRPMLEPMHQHSLTSAILRGPSLLALPPIVFANHDETEAVVVMHLGRSLCGHDGIIHGGLLATVFDEALARNALMNIPSKIGVTATLDVKYRKPVMADQFVVIRTKLDKADGRKLHVSAEMDSLDGEVMCTARGLFVEPKYAKYMKSPFRDTKPDRVPKPVQPSTHTPAEPVFTSGNASENYIAASPNEEGDEKKVSQFPAIFGGGNAAGTTKVGKKHSPGIVLDENGKPCKVCNSWQTWTKATKKGIHTDASPPPAPETRPTDCPLDVEELGRATWGFLHTAAAYYPDEPTPSQRASMYMFIKSFADFYPCSYCATDFRHNIAETKPDVSSREALSKWLCDRHNEVNVKLGKETFDCGLTDERWKDGWKDGRCD